MSDHPAYEIYEYRPNGEKCGSVVLGRMPEAEALALAQAYADRWRATAALCRVPFVDDGSSSQAWLAEEVRLIAQLVPTVAQRL